MPKLTHDHADTSMKPHLILGERVDDDWKAAGFSLPPNHFRGRAAPTL